MHPADPNSVILPLLFRDRLGRADFEAVGKEAHFLIAHPKLLQTPRHERVKVEEVTTDLRLRFPARRPGAGTELA